MGRPMRKCPAMRNEPSSASSVDIGANGREFNMPSASTKTVYISSHVIG